MNEIAWFHSFVLIFLSCLHQFAYMMEILGFFLLAIVHDFKSASLG